MPAMGLEPIRCCHQQILSLPRLPFRHAGKFVSNVSILSQDISDCKKNFDKISCNLFLLTKVIIYDNLNTCSRSLYRRVVQEETGSKDDLDMRFEAGEAHMRRKILKKMTSPREDVVRQLKEVRKAEGMTQEHLAELVGTKKSNISRLESGRYNPSLDFLVKVADGLGKQISVKVM